eukprot:990049-Prorocentrum_minimum.AAC.1
MPVSRANRVKRWGICSYRAQRSSAGFSAGSHARFTVSSWPIRSSGARWRSAWQVAGATRAGEARCTRAAASAA